MRIFFVYNTPSLFHTVRVRLCFVNRIDPFWIPLALLQQETAHWENTEIYPSDYVQDIRDLQFNFAQQYVGMSLLDEDHPSYRVNLMPYPLYRKTRYESYVHADTDSDTD